MLCMPLIIEFPKGLTFLEVFPILDALLIRKYLTKSDLLKNFLIFGSL